MKILVATNHLATFGGTETYTYALVNELLRIGHSVDVFTFKQGIVSQMIAYDMRVNVIDKVTCGYDIILANHTTCVDELYKAGPIIQTCHGTIPKLEQPNLKADIHVAISFEVSDYVSLLTQRDVTVVHNGIDCDRFKPMQPLNRKVKKVLSLCQNDEFNIELKQEFEARSIGFVSLNKFSNPIWDVELLMNEADMVISLGRGAYEAMACGRAVLVMDKRPYQAMMGDGLILPTNIANLIKTNCSGRTNRFTDVKWLIDEALKLYHPDLCSFGRSFALFNLNIVNQTQQYIDLWRLLM